MTDILLKDGLTDPMNGELMGEETERLIEEYGVTRAELDEVAYLSNSRAAAATAYGSVTKSCSITVQERKKSIVIANDEGIRPEQYDDGFVGGITPCLWQSWLAHRRQSSQISDGAAAMVLASKKAVEQYNLKPIARVLGGTWSVLNWVCRRPIPVIGKLMKKLQTSVDSFDLFENNEAFSHNVLLRKALEIPYEKINVYGGAIALGHPIWRVGRGLLSRC